MHHINKIFFSRRLVNHAKQSIYIFLFCLLLSEYLYASEKRDTTPFFHPQDTLSPTIDQQKSLLQPLQYSPISIKKSFHSLTPLYLSAVIPGLGQYYSNHPVKGTWFASAEILLTLYLLNTVSYSKTLQQEGHSLGTKKLLYMDSLSLFTSDLSQYQRYYELIIKSAMLHDIALFREKNILFSTYNTLFWLGGFYAWNLADILQTVTNYSLKKREINASRAVVLSLIPYCALGQLYNGSLFKAGLIWTTQATFTFMAYHYHQLMLHAIQKHNQVSATTKIDKSFRLNTILEWENEYNTAFRNRNTYLWMFVLFYFYGIFDAMVDAHLHDYKVKMQLEPELLSYKPKITASISYFF